MWPKASSTLLPKIQKPHVEQDVANAAVQEHRGEQRQEHVLAGDRILGSVETDVGHDLFAPERESGGDFAGNGCSLVDELAARRGAAPESRRRRSD